jgi:hypothetical protein
MSRWSSAAVAALATGVITACGSNGSNATLGKPITLAQFESLRWGAPRAQVTKQFGRPESRQKIGEFGFTHEEPKKQQCIYYRRQHPDIGDPWSSSDTFQLCFQGSRLRHKWAYIAARA